MGCCCGHHSNKNGVRYEDSDSSHDHPQHGQRGSHDCGYHRGDAAQGFGMLATVLVIVAILGLVAWVLF